MSNDFDAEIRAMNTIREALSTLDEAATTRVLQWAISRFQTGTVVTPAATSPSSGETTEPQTEAEGGEAEQSFGDLASLYDAASPTSDIDKALVCAYWLQELEGHPDLTAQAVNKELKHLGHGVGNITRAFDRLKSLKPALIMQTRKEGKSQQARKRFKVTAEGKKAVQRMIRETA